MPNYLKELKDIIAAAATFAGLNALRLVKPEDFELTVECALLDVPVHEAAEWRQKLSRIADTLGSQASGREGSNWKNVAFNLDPSTGNSQRVGRSFSR
jgi:hypothetical protein